MCTYTHRRVWTSECALVVCTWPVTALGFASWSAQRGFELDMVQSCNAFNLSIQPIQCVNWQVRTKWKYCCCFINAFIHNIFSYLLQNISWRSMLFWCSSNSGLARRLSQFLRAWLVEWAVYLCVTLDTVCDCKRLNKENWRENIIIIMCEQVQPFSDILPEKIGCEFLIRKCFNFPLEKWGSYWTLVITDCDWKWKKCD